MVDFLILVEVVINGLMAGVLYSLVALGFVLIFKASGVFNSCETWRNRRTPTQTHGKY